MSVINWIGLALLFVGGTGLAVWAMRGQGPS